MGKNSLIYLSSNVIKLIVTLLIIVPVTTYYLNVEEIATYTFIGLISNFIMVPIGAGGHMIIASHYFTVGEDEKKKMFFHVYMIELILKILMFIFVIFFGEALLSYIFNIYKEEYYYFLLIFSGALIFDVTKPIFYYIFTIQKKAKQFFLYNSVEILLNLLFITLLFYYFEFGLEGYFLSVLLTAFFMFIVNIMTMYKNFEFEFDKEWLSIIYHKGFKLFYANVVEKFIGLYDSYLVQSFLNLYSLGIYTHAKQYIDKFSIIDKAYFDSYSASYMRMLNNDENLNIFKITFVWYSFLLITGIFIIYFSEYIIGYLTHGKFVESAEIVSFLYVLVFFRSNQMQYTCQLLFNRKNKEYANLSTFANILGFIILTVGVFVFNGGLYFIIFSYVFNVVLRNVFIKSFVIYKYRKIDVSELFFFISLFIYLGILFMEIDLVI